MPEATRVMARAHEEAAVLPEIEACIPALRRYATALLRDRQGADDLVHDALLRALDRLHTRRGEFGMRPWLFTILHNLFVSQARRARTRRDSAPLDAAGEDAAWLRASQEDGLHWRDLQRALDMLPQEQRAVLLLVSVEDLSYAEAARALGIPLGTVMSRLARARERMRQLAGEAPHSGLRRVK